MRTVFSVSRLTLEDEALASSGELSFLSALLLELKDGGSRGNGDLELVSAALANGKLDGGGTSVGSCINHVSVLG